MLCWHSWNKDGLSHGEEQEHFRSMQEKPYDIGQAPAIVTSFTQSSWGKLPQSMEMAIKGFIFIAHGSCICTCTRVQDMSEDRWHVNIYGMKIEWPVIRGVWKHWRYIANAAAQIVSLESQQPYPNHSRKLHFHYNSLSVCLACKVLWFLFSSSDHAMVPVQHPYGIGYT